MSYEASIVYGGESFLSRCGTDANQLLAWILTCLERDGYRGALGVIRNQLDEHEPPQVYVANNPHLD